MPTKNTDLLGLYIHWPYCLSKCPYCDFASCVCNKIDEDLLLHTYIRDLMIFKTNRTITSIFFGGGTPSLMSKSFFNHLMNAIQKNYHLSPDCEISLEANPDAINKDKMQFFRDHSVNRLSIGVQSFNPKDLIFLGRKHSVQTAISTIENAKKFFHNINIDLIYARPHQQLKKWDKELEIALSFDIPHYSLYQLTIEENTIFEKKHIRTASEEQMRRLYIETDYIMNQAEHPAYEISNYSKKGFECRHNMTYWLGGNYIGIGPAAHGRLGCTATSNLRSVTGWIKTPPQKEQLTFEQRQLEKLLMGLRLRHHFYPVINLNQEGIKQALQRGWIIQNKQGICPTIQGSLMLNQLILMLAP